MINGTLYLEVVGTDNNNYYKTTTDGINFSNWIQGTGDAETTPLVDFNGYNYDFRRGDSSASQPALCVQQSPIPPAEIVSVEFDRFEQPDRLLDNNPGNGKPNTDVGLRIFPDQTTPTDNTNRAKVKVKATLSSSMPGVPIYFRVYDIDDPSDNAAPIDTTGSLGADNRGKVGTSSAGKLNLASATTDSFGQAEVELEVTKQPGDNFAVIASKSSTFLNGASINEQNIQVGGQTIPISGTTYSTDPSNPAIRTQTLTVWRKFHIEVDSMGDVPNSNDVDGNKFEGNIATSPGVTSQGDRIFTVTPALEVARFDNGRIEFPNPGSPSTFFQIRIGNANTFALIGDPPGAGAINPGRNFILYDDDDYNNDDGINKDGDSNEPTVVLQDSFKYMSAEDGYYLDGKPKNLYASAFIKPEYNWASSRNYNQSNLTFELNVEDGTNNATVINVVNRNRDSKNDERDDFWVGYVLIGYQGPLLRDFDGLSPSGTTNEDARQGVAPNEFIVGVEIPSCDCYSSIICPIVGTVCQVNGTPKLPRGAMGAIIFQEVNQDLKKYFISPPPIVTPRIIEDIKLTIPHEMAHQFGVLGDQKGETFKIMNYSNYVGNQVNEESFHPEHINIMRWRVKSPGN